MTRLKNKSEWFQRKLTLHKRLLKTLCQNPRLREDRFVLSLRSQVFGKKRLLTRRQIECAVKVLKASQSLCTPRTGSAASTPQEGGPSVGHQSTEHKGA